MDSQPKGHDNPLDGQHIIINKYNIYKIIYI